MANQIGNSVDLSYVDKRRVMTVSAQADTKITSGVAVFTANASGTTTTLVGANAAPGVNDVNVIRRGEKFRLFNSSGVLKEEKVFTVTNIAVAASTTMTFSPAAAVATASGDIARLVTYQNYLDEANLDTRLAALGFSASQISLMTQNDKVYAIRLRDDPGSL
jgi:hypothetical protein